MENQKKKDVTVHVEALNMKATVNQPKIIVGYWEKHPVKFFIAVIFSFVFSIITGCIAYFFRQSFWMGIVFPSIVGFVAAVLGLIVLPPYKNKVKEITQT